MGYRKLPRGNEMIGTLGLGLGGIQKSSQEEIQAVIERAIENGINFFDLCAGGKNVYEPFGKAIAGKRDKVYFQLHFGAVYKENGEYGWSRNLTTIKNTFEWELKALGTEYVDFGFLHCIDEESDFQDIIKNGIFDYVKELKEKGVVRHIGFSSHTPGVANKLLDTGIMDLMMFSINPAYDLECGDEYGIGTTTERAELFRRCEKEGVGISVMKPFHGGQLLSANTSPFKQELTMNQCIQYCLDRPAVLTVVPGVRNLSDLSELLKYPASGKEERDYSLIGEFTPESAVGNCVYCNHCQPCPAGIDIGIVNKYYDLSLAGDKMAADHYGKLVVKADACIKCGHCDKRCPFKVKQQAKMQKINEYFISKKMSDLELAKNNLSGHSICLFKDGNCLTDDSRGISPMMNFIEREVNLSGYSVADLVVGKATALLFVKCGIKSVFAKTLSQNGKKILGLYGVDYEYEVLTEKIKNRVGTDMCPMEKAVMNTDDPEEAYEILKNKLIELKNNKPQS